MMSRYGKFLLWIAAAAVWVSALWVLNVEITYQRNVRHIPTNFRERYHPQPHRWKA
jgi:hypothetical protein